MKRRILAALLSTCLTLALAVPALAAAPAVVSIPEATQVIQALGIMAGDENGDMNLASKVNRAEFVTMAVKATPGGDQIGQASTSPYPDVPWKHWASGYVEAGVAAGMISGYADGTFRPSNTVTLAEGATIALQLLGYGPTDFSGAYPSGQMAMYRSLKLDKGMTAAAATTPLTRQDAMYLFYNLMTANTKEGSPYLNTLGHSLNGAGEIDLVSLINGVMEGPVLAQGSWKSSLTLDVSKAAVYRDGRLVTVGSVQNNDVIYWNNTMNSVWAYSDKVTGTIQSLEPSSASPTSVTVAGRTCTIETAAAALALSDLGEYALGDTVTLLLGRSGGVAAVVGPLASEDSLRLGVITEVTTKSYSDGKGGSYNAKTVTMLSTDGKEYSYEHKGSGMQEGYLVQATVSGADGSVTLRGVSNASLTGRVNATGTTLGNRTLASGVEILDTGGRYAARIFPSRLAGLNLSETMVRYYTTNADGEIDRLILKEVTGDMYQYGILTDMISTPTGNLGNTYSYELNIGGVETGIPQTNTKFPVSLGPVQVEGAASAPEKMYSLTSAGTGQISNNQFAVGGRTYTISDDVAIYEYRNGDYYLSSTQRVQEGDYTLTGWYDKVDINGGRIRVIVARES